mmetsp:Transcript_49155/g.124727  ORF Transcript_49155/g.124727 Transcript_49155/m.124727 type:complete len:213 (+) Transcript_49155:286-924(+)
MFNNRQATASALQRGASHHELPHKDRQVVGLVVVLDGARQQARQAKPPGTDASETSISVTASKASQPSLPSNSLASAATEEPASVDTSGVTQALVSLDAQGADLRMQKRSKLIFRGSAPSLACCPSCGDTAGDELAAGEERIARTERPQRSKMGSASGLKSMHRLSSSVLSGSHRRPMAAPAVSAKCTSGTAVASGPPAQPASKGPAWSGNG